MEGSGAGSGGGGRGRRNGNDEIYSTNSVSGNSSIRLLLRIIFGGIKHVPPDITYVCTIREIPGTLLRIDITANFDNSNSRIDLS